MKEKRWAVQGFRRLLVGVLGLIAVSAIAAGIVLFTPLFSIKNIHVNGLKHLSYEEVVKLSGLGVGDRMLSVDEYAAGAAIIQQPWVDRVTVARNWPRTVTIDLTERDVVLFSEEQDGRHLIDADGVAFTIGDPPQEAVEVSGDAVKDPAIMRQVAAAMAFIEQPIRVQLRDVTVASAYDVTVHLKDGRSVYWGSLQDNHDKARALKTVLSHNGDKWNISNPQLVTVR